ncbi:MAG: 6-phosphogluconolactonase [Minisyncoccota bacterium]
MNETDKLARAMGEDMGKMLVDIKKSRRAMLLFLSSGSAFDALKYIPDDSLGGFLSITMLDERYDPNGKNSNFAALTRLPFFSRAQMCGVQLIDTCVSLGERADELCARIESDVHAWILEHPNGMLAATAGVGADGHTAGIMPFPESPECFVELFKNEHWFVSYNTGEKNPIPHRVTSTITFLQTLDRVFVYAVGEEKREALAAMQREGSLAECPARILLQLRAQFYLNTTN